MDYVNKLNDYNGNKYLAGIALLMLNLGSKYLIVDISKGTENLLKLKIIRRFTIFSILFIGTRNIVTSLVLTGVFILFSNGLFNEDSKYYILPDELKEENVTKEDYEKALKTIQKYEKYAKFTENMKVQKDNKKNNYNELKKQFLNTN
jgi:uncharacterized membrane protein (DUF485 family)